MSGYGYNFGSDYFGKGSHAKDILWGSLPSFYREEDAKSVLSFQGIIGQGDGLRPKTFLLPFTAIKPTTFSVTYVASSVPHTLTDDIGDGVLYESGLPTSYSINYVTGRLTLPISDDGIDITASFSYYEKYLEKFVSALAIVSEELRFITEAFGTLLDPLAIRPDLLYNLSSNLALLEKFWLEDETFCRLFLENVGTWTLRKGEVFGIKLLARCLGFEAEVVDLWEYELLPLISPPPPPISPTPVLDPNPPDDYLVRAGDSVLCGKNYTPDTNDVFFCLTHQSEWLPEEDIITKTTPSGYPLTQTGMAQGGAAEYIILAPSASERDNCYVGYTITITGGTGAGQSRVIDAYDGISKKATIRGLPWSPEPDETSQYSIRLWIPYADRHRWNTNKFFVIVS